MTNRTQLTWFRRLMEWLLRLHLLPHNGIYLAKQFRTSLSPLVCTLLPIFDEEWLFLPCRQCHLILFFLWQPHIFQMLTPGQQEVCGSDQLDVVYLSNTNHLLRTLSVFPTSMQGQDRLDKLRPLLINLKTVLFQGLSIYHTSPELPAFLRNQKEDTFLSGKVVS